MKVLVATSRTQGARSDDFNWCVEGELVWVQEPCWRDKRRDPRSCGCGRAFAGLASHRSTTTAAVKELPWMTVDRYVDAMCESFRATGWPADLAPIVAVDLARFAATWPTGAILQRDLDSISLRTPLDAHPQTHHEPDNGGDH